MITRTAIVYVVTMLLGAVILALVARVWPVAGEGSFTPLFILLVVSFIYDVVVMRFGTQLQLGMLTMPQRFIGFIGGVFTFLMVHAALQGKPLTFLS